MIASVTRFLLACVPAATLLAAVPPPVGTWKLQSEQSIEGNAPAYRQGLVMSITPNPDGSVRAKTDGPVPASVIGHDRMHPTLSADGQTLTEEATGRDSRGRVYRYVLVWKKQ